MARQVLAVYEPSQFYVERFLNYANSKGHTGFDIIGFTDLKALEDCTLEHGIKVLLLSWVECPDDDKDIKALCACVKKISENGVEIFILGEQQNTGFILNSIKESGGFLPDPERIIEKYQPVSLILQEVINKAFGDDCLTGYSLPTQEALMNVCGIYSPADKQSHPELAEKIARLKGFNASSLCRVLYINLEQFSGLSKVTGADLNTGLSDVIYYYRQNIQGLREAIDRAKGHFDGIDVLLAPADMEDLREIDEKEWPDFLRSIMEAGDYHLAVIDDLGKLFSLKNILRKIGEVYIPALPPAPGKNALRKMEEFKKYFYQNDCPELLEKIKEIEMDPV